jgi:cytochrome c2
VADVGWARMVEAGGSRRIRVLDPYEGAVVEFDAIHFVDVLDAVYGPEWRKEEEILFTCSDGYQPTVPVARFLEHEAWLAYDRPGDAGFTIAKTESGVRKRIQLTSYYLVWENLESEKLRADGDYGWPYQLESVDLIRVRDRFPEMVPPEGASDAARRGFVQFRTHCSRCHAVNGVGGTIGPDLNRPTNPVRVRERDWLVRWIDDPSAILPAARMPRLNPFLAEREKVIDQLLAYLEVMADAPAGPAS